MMHVHWQCEVCRKKRHTKEMLWNQSVLKNWPCSHTETHGYALTYKTKTNKQTNKNKNKNTHTKKPKLNSRVPTSPRTHKRRKRKRKKEQVKQTTKTPHYRLSFKIISPPPPTSYEYFNQSSANCHYHPLYTRKLITALRNTYTV